MSSEDKIETVEEALERAKRRADLWEQRLSNIRQLCEPVYHRDRYDDVEDCTFEIVNSIVRELVLWRSLARTQNRGSITTQEQG